MTEKGLGSQLVGPQKSTLQEAQGLTAKPSTTPTFTFHQWLPLFPYFLFFQELTLIPSDCQPSLPRPQTNHHNRLFAWSSHTTRRPLLLKAAHTAPVPAGKEISAKSLSHPKWLTGHGWPTIIVQFSGCTTFQINTSLLLFHCCVKLKSIEGKLLCVYKVPKRTWSINHKCPIFFLRIKPDLRLFEDSGLLIAYHAE